MPNDLTKLPKWAQQEMDRLQRNVERWKAKATAGPETSDTWVHDHAGRTPLGTDVEVVFSLPGGRELSVHRDGNQLVVRGDGHGAIAAVPHVTNVLMVRLVPHVAPLVLR